MAFPTEFLNRLPGGYLCFTDEGILVQINQHLLNQLDYQASEVVGQSIERLLTMAGRIFYQTHVYPLLKLRGQADELVLTLRMKNGQSLPVLLNVASVRQDDQLFHQGVCLPVKQRQRYEAEILQAKRVAEQALRDNTELRVAKQALEQHQHLLDEQLAALQQKNQEYWQFSQLITHDLQEPLRKITLLADALLQEASGQLVLDDGKLLGRIVDASQRMRVLIRRLRDYLQLETARDSVDSVALLPLVVSARELVSQSQQWPMVAVELVTDQLPLIEGDRGQLLELFYQLMANSVQFGQPAVEGPVVITITSQLVAHNRFRSIAGKYHYEPFVQLTYRDNGPGIEASLGDKLFQIHKSPSPGLIGLGFGLATCKKIVDNHGGSISLLTISQPGARQPGAPFSILLPIQASRSPGNGQASANPA